MPSWIHSVIFAFQNRKKESPFAIPFTNQKYLLMPLGVTICRCPSKPVRKLVKGVFGITLNITILNL